jgi:hypothetical protein
VLGEETLPALRDGDGGGILFLGEGTLQAGDVGGESSSIDDPNDGSGAPAASSFQKAMVPQALALLVDSHNQ